VNGMNPEARAATALLIFAATLSGATILAIMHSSAALIVVALVVGILATIVFCALPTLHRWLMPRRH